MGTDSNTKDCNGPMADQVHFNVGGTKFSTTWATLQRLPSSKLGRLHERINEIKGEHTEFFFDRNPAVFGCILDFYRNGVLHLPETVCGRQIREELQFWDISAGLVSSCCWRVLYKDDGVEKTMRLLDMELPVFPNGMQMLQKAEKVTSTIWNLLEYPSSSLMAKGYMLFYFLVVVASVIPDLLDHGTFHVLDLANVVFLLDVLTRFIMSPYKARFFLSVINVLDILALLACAVTLIISLVGLLLGRTLHTPSLLQILGFLRMLKYIRFYRVLKANRSLALLLLAMFKSKRTIFMYVAIMIINCVLIGILFFWFERLQRQQTMGESIHWAFITMTTIGYGDIIPLTTGGRVLSVLCGISGLILLALPISAIYHNFSTLYSHNRDRERHVTDLDRCRPTVMPFNQPAQIM
ncbi:Potassium voltage-gated channel protein Shaw [Mizuhopecten yessoensis]|uniref:Potassium voltage-gated channel protein Shaw n=1 Tax=Mizuhopecten yessoensis TaxID=6573 RepID=A0A210PI15_MIZYE|nr:Potassium voltage-gated channel protein Shaw [Mizuhopecten yessoensis]